MEQTICKCEMCKKVAKDEKQKRHENWIEVDGGLLKGIQVWLEKPRKHKKGITASFMIHIGWQERLYHFCSIDCLVKALKGSESI